MRMAVGVNVPYTDRPWPRQTWDMLTRLQPDEITLTSFIDEGELSRLCHDFPNALYHVRPRTGPQHISWQRTYAEAGSNILGYRSWDTERSLDECLYDMIGHLPAGAHPRGCHRITVLMGNEPTLEWAPPYPSLTQVKGMCEAYVGWFHENAVVIRDVYAGVIGIAVAPAAQGDDTREMMYMSEVLRAGCYAVADSFADHNYFPINSGPVSSPAWGGRATRAMDVIGWDVHRRGRARVTEANDNGDRYGRSDRGLLYRDYIAWAGRSGAYESVSLFTLPGAPDDASKPSWWFIDDAIIRAVRAARDKLPDLPILTTEGIVLPPKPPEGSTVPEKSNPLVDAANGGQTLTADQLHAKRWAAHALPSLPVAPAFNPEFGFEQSWRKTENAWWGSPLTVNEDKLDAGDGSDLLAARVFTNAVVIWRPGSGAEILG